MSFTRWGVNYHLDRIYGSGDPPTLYVAVMTEEVGRLDTGSSLREPSGNGYQRVTVPNTNAYWGDAADGLKTNAQDIVFPQATGRWGTLRFWAICTQQTEGQVLVWGRMTSQLVIQGGSLRFRRDQLSITSR